MAGQLGSEARRRLYQLPGGLPPLLEHLGFTAILLGYLTVWLPNRAAGLALLGLELAEWLKFLPAVQSGEVGPRGVFYLPPISLGVLMLLASVNWPRVSATWAWRGLALLVSLLALPPVEALLDAPAERLRSVILIGLVVIVLTAVALGWLERLGLPARLALAAGVALAGGALPLLVYREVRALVSFLVGTPLGVGVGVWLHAIGHALVLAAVVWRVREKRPARVAGR